MEKRFSSLSDWQQECLIYEKLQGSAAVPDVFVKRSKLLVTEYCFCHTLTEELDRQLVFGFDPQPWMSLAVWLRRCQEMTGLLPGDGHLRNFLWDKGRRHLLGIDFENYVPVSMEECGAKCVGYVMESSPADLPVKLQTAELLMELLDIPVDLVEKARMDLRKKRTEGKVRKMTGVVLAACTPKILGKEKALLELGGTHLLVRQVEKLQKLGIREILVSGSDHLELPGTKVVQDRSASRSPMAGLCACLEASFHSCCLVVSVDTPLIPPAALARMSRQHREGVTVLSRHGREEPLIGVYDRSLASEMRRMLRQGGIDVRNLAERVPWQRWEYLGPDEFLYNCRPAEEFERIRHTVDKFRIAGIALD